MTSTSKKHTEHDFFGESSEADRETAEATSAEVETEKPVKAPAPKTQSSDKSDGAAAEKPGDGDATAGDREIYIIDGHSQVFKAYHGIRQLSTSTGIPTNAIYGFVQILHRLFKTRKPSHVVVVFDSSGPTFRHELYEEYKANRDAPPEDFSQQMSYINQILEHMRLKVLVAPGFEADDIIATLTRRATAEGFKVRVVTADKDLMQLVDDDVEIIRLMPDSEIIYDREAVKEKMGVYPEQIGDLLAMVGDTSDNIPGIPRVGMKTAAKLLDQYGTLANVLDNVHELKGKQAEYVEAGRESALLSQKLVALHYDVDIDCVLDDCTLAEPDLPSLLKIYRELEFRRLIDELETASPETVEALEAATARETDYRIINTEEALEEFCEKIRKAKFVGLDVETNELQVIVANLVGISLSVEANTGVYIPLGHTDPLGEPTDQMPQLPLEVVQRHLGPILADPEIKKYAHNLKFDWHLLRRHGLDLDHGTFDTLLASYLINADRRTHGLKDLAADLLHIRMTPITDLIGKGKGQISFDQVEIEPAAQYAAADADLTLQLTHFLEPRLEEANGRRLLDEVELPLVRVLMDMEATGVCIDKEHFAQLAVETNEHLDRLRQEIYSHCDGKEFNLGSPKQVAQVLFEDLGLKPVKSKKTGYSTDIEVLEALACDHEVPRLLAEYRQFEKLKSTYIDVLPTLICEATGRIHTSYNQAVAATGRLSSSDPNLQNIPIRTEWGRKIRAGFVPSAPDRVLLGADYSQIELRVLAHVTEDPSLVNAYTTGIDVHALTASKVYDVPVESVSPEMRNVAKMVNFGVIYGMSAMGLSQRLKIPFATARSFIEEYFKGYAGVREWLDATLAAARNNGYVETVSGRRRMLPDIRSKNFNARSASERVAVNAPIQGSSADMIKIAMIGIHNRMKEAGLASRMIMQVHDELIFDVVESELEQMKGLVREEMENALPLKVPVVVEMGTGKNWEVCK